MTGGDPTLAAGDIDGNAVPAFSDGNTGGDASLLRETYVYSLPVSAPVNETGGLLARTSEDR